MPHMRRRLVPETAVWLVFWVACTFLHVLAEGEQALAPGAWVDAPGAATNATVHTVIITDCSRQRMWQAMGTVYS